MTIVPFPAAITALPGEAIPPIARPSKVIEAVIRSNRLFAIAAVVRRRPGKLSQQPWAVAGTALTPRPWDVEEGILPYAIWWTPFEEQAKAMAFAAASHAGNAPPLRVVIERIRYEVNARPEALATEHAEVLDAAEKLVRYVEHRMRQMQAAGEMTTTNRAYKLYRKAWRKRPPDERGPLRTFRQFSDDLTIMACESYVAEGAPASDPWPSNQNASPSDAGLIKGLAPVIDKT